ncbi:MAG: beta-galactosidase [Planctomycetes bacterium]|nr:beta-galactosidase [Planctomycetota bacterium]
MAALALLLPTAPAEEPTEEDIEHLRFDLEEADAEKRDEMVRTLARTMSALAAPALLTVLASPNEEDLPPTLQLAERHACRLADARVVPTCRDMLQSKDPAVRRSACRVLPFAGSPEAVALLKRAMEDPELRVRAAAIDGLGCTQDPDLIPFLNGLSRSPDSATAGAAQVALRTLFWQTGRRPREDFSQRVWPMRSIVLVGSQPFWSAWFGADRLHCRLLVQSFSLAGLEAGLVPALSRTRLLIVSQQGDEARREIFRSPRCREAIQDLLKRGGTLFFDGETVGDEAAAFLAELEVTLPEGAKRDVYSAVPSAEEVHSFTAWPFRLDAESAGLDGSIAWQAWGRNQCAPYRSQASPALAALVVQENVLGSGRVVFSGITGLWDTNQRHGDRVENLLATAFDSPDRTLYYFFRLRHDFQLPAWTFARPWAGPKLKALFIGDSYLKRDLVELCQRTDLLDIEYACLVERREGPYERHSNALEGASVVDVQQKIAGDYDVYVVARRGRARMRKHWELLPEEIRRLVLRRVRLGAGLIVLGSGSGLEKEGKPDREIGELRDLPLLEDDFAFTAAACPYPTPERRSGRESESTLHLRRAGLGRIVLIDDFPKPGPELASPGLTGPFLRYRHHDGTYSLFLRTLLWAGRKMPEIEVQSLLAKPAAAPTDLGLVLRNASPDEKRLTLALEVVNTSEEVRGHSQETASLAAGEEREIRLPLPPGLPPGLLVARVSLRLPDGRAANWAVTAFHRRSEEDLAGVAFDRPAYGPGDTLQARVRFQKALAEDAQLEFQLVDTYGRLMTGGRSAVSAGRSEMDVSCSMPEPLAWLADLHLRLTRGQTVLGEEKFPVGLAQPRRDREDFKWYVWRSAGLGEERLATVRLGVDYAHGGPADAENSLRYNGGITVFSFDPAGNPGGSEGLARRPCFQNTSYHDQVIKRVDEAAESFFLKCGVKDIMLGDEQTIGGAYCFCPTCRFHFREWARRSYPSLEAMNAEWATAFKDWEDVRACTLEELKDPARPGAWLDHRRYMDSVFSARVRRYREAIQAHDPGAAVGLSGTQKDSPFVNYDWWQLAHAGNFWLAYGGAQTKLRRSFRTPDTIMAQWGGGYGRMDNNEIGTRQAIWSLLFNHYDAFAYYWGGSDAFIMLEPDLTPINRAVWTAEEIREIQQGSARMLLRSELDTFGIGVHYSLTSHYSAEAAAKIQPGRPDFTDNLLSLGMPVEDLRYQFTYVAYQEIELGELRRRHFKVLLLPDSEAISTREAQEIRQFVEEGGIAVADFAAAQRNEHGTWQSPGLLDDLFGFSVARPASGFRKAALEVTRELAGLEPGPYGEFLAPSDGGLALAEAEAFGVLRAGDQTAPALLRRTLGRGQAVALNFSLSGYGSLRVAGSGGELTEIERAKVQQGAKTRAIVEAILRLAGVDRGFDWLDAEGRGDLSQAFLYRRGPLRYLGVLPASTQPDPVNREKKDAYQLLLPGKAFVTDCRRGELLGEDRTFSVHPVAGMASLFAILPYRVQAIRVAGGRFAPGAEARLVLEVETSGPTPAEHVLHAEVWDSTGRVREEYARNVVAEDGRATFAFPLALNDPPGEWRAEVRDAATGARGQGDFAVSPAGEP